MSTLKPVNLLFIIAFLVATACSSSKLGPGDPDKCLAGEVLVEGECVPAGCELDIHCDDGNPCNGVEKCIDRRCSRGGVIVESCDDGVDCTRDSCDRVLAECMHVVDDELCQKWEQCDAQDGCIGRTCTSDQNCSDGLYCNGTETCKEGQCIGSRLDCADDIPCTQDSCSEESDQCQNVPDHEACPAGEICHPIEGCKVKPCESPANCDDGSYCNGEEICETGKCLGGLAVLCDDRLDCTEDECDETLDRCIYRPEDSLCDDQEYCNGVETCDATLDCVPGAVIACQDHVNCTRDLCNEDLDACQYTPDDTLCATDEICDPTSGCEDRPECQTNADCPGGMVCKNEVCIGQTEEPQPTDGGDDGGMEEEDGGSGDDACCIGDDGGMPEGDAAPADVGGDEGGDEGGEEECTEGESRPCNTGIPGECADGMDYCEDGVWSGCQQTYFSQPEMCDGLDNDCDGDPDDEYVCACLTGCEDLAVCELLGNAICEHIPGYMTACIEHCTGYTACTSSAEGNPMVCVDVPDYALGPLCMCETTACPQNCQIDRDCYPYGLTLCDDDLKCRSNCADDKNCPPPYVCEESQGLCVCDPTNIGISCLECGIDTDCHLGARCTYRDDQTNPRMVFKECQYDCNKAIECPQDQYGGKLYCHWGMGNTANRCACDPERACQECLNMDPDPCEISWMTCTTFTNPQGMDITACTVSCQSDDLCPAGWYCRDDGISAHGWCIEKECHCTDTKCGTGGIDPIQCAQLFPGFECIPDTSQDPPVELCSRSCGSHMECPVGYWCDTDGSTGTPICRCAAPPPP